MDASGKGGVPRPEALDWHSGKTAASKRFVTEAEQRLPSIQNAGAAALLRKIVEAVKEGHIVLREYVDLDDWLAT